MPLNITNTWSFVIVEENRHGMIILGERSKRGKRREEPSDSKRNKLSLNLGAT